MLSDTTSATWLGNSRFNPSDCFPSYPAIRFNRRQSPTSHKRLLARNNPDCRDPIGQNSRFLKRGRTWRSRSRKILASWVFVPALGSHLNLCHFELLQLPAQILHAALVADVCRKLQSPFQIIRRCGSITHEEIKVRDPLRNRNSGRFVV